MLPATLTSPGAFALARCVWTGETTGNFEEVLDKAAEHFRLMTGVALRQLSAALGIAATLSVGLCVGLCVGLILVGFYA